MSKDASETNAGIPETNTDIPEANADILKINVANANALEINVTTTEPETDEPETDVDKTGFFKSEWTNLNNYFVKLSSKKTQNVINNTLKYYVYHAQLHKIMFFALNTALLFINFFIVLINNRLGEFFKDSKLIITVLAGASTLITGITAFFGFLNKWTRYRTNAEALKSECNNYNACCGEYKLLKRLQDRESLFVQRFEEINKKDIHMWCKENNDLYKGDSAENGKGSEESVPMEESVRRVKNIVGKFDEDDIRAWAKVTYELDDGDSADDGKGSDMLKSIIEKFDENDMRIWAKVMHELDREDNNYEGGEDKENDVG